VFTVKLAISAEVIFSVIALIKKPNPNTTIQPSGIATSRINGRTSRLTIPSSRAATVANTYTGTPPSDWKLMPGMTWAVSRSATVSTNQTARKRISFWNKFEIVFIKEPLLEYFWLKYLL